MDYRYLKLIGWTMLGAGVGLMTVANEAVRNPAPKAVKEDNLNA